MQVAKATPIVVLLFQVEIEDDSSDKSVPALLNALVFSLLPAPGSCVDAAYDVSIRSVFQISFQCNI